MAAHSARLTAPQVGSGPDGRSSGSRRLLRDVLRRLGPARGAHTGPRVALALPPFTRGERILAAERDTAGSPVVATTHALYHYAPQLAEPLPHGRHHADELPPGWRRLAWDEVGRLGWDSTRRTLNLVALTPGPTDPFAVHLPRHTPMVDLVRDRVGATLVVSRRIPVGERRTALITGRRRPGTTAVTWVVVLQADHDSDPGSGPATGSDAARANGAGPDDPAVREAIAEAIRRLRAELRL